MNRDTKSHLYMAGIWAIVIVQALCTLFFTVELFSEVFGLRSWSVAWRVREILQVAASLGLVIGTFAGVLYLRSTWMRMRNMRRQVAAAGGAFQEMLYNWFRHWGLTPAESEVALFAVKGLSNGEIAEIRGKSEATIKAQMNAVFRKSGAGSRAQLLSLFVDELLHPAPGRQADPSGPISPH